MFATKISDFDDFITPSQECVKMILPSTSDKQTKSSKVIIDKDMVNFEYFTRLIG